MRCQADLLLSRFGNSVSDEITRDMLHAPTLPRKLNLVAVAMVAITPLCKYSLSSTCVYESGGGD